MELAAPPAFVVEPPRQERLSVFASQKFRFWSLVSMLLLVYVHGYSLNDRYLQPWTLPGEPMTATGFFEYFLANGIFRFRIPMLFAISGYLFALQDARPHRARMRKRVHTLLVPYLLWSALMLGVFFLLELIPFTRAVVAQSHMMQVDETRLFLHQNKWWEVLLRWTFFPAAYQLWFIRVLLIYNLAYPLLRRCVTHPVGKWIFFSCAFLLWLATFGTPLVEGEGLLFFSLGIRLQKAAFDIEKPSAGLRPLPWALAFVGMAAVKTWLAFRGSALMDGFALTTTLIVLHKLTIASGFIAAWFGLDGLVRWCMARPWFVALTAFSFVIYAFHAPLVALAIEGIYMHGGAVPHIRLLTFLLLPLLLIVLAIGLGATLRRLAPRVYSLLTGGRGKS